MNDNRWTNMTYAEKERIECSMLIVVKELSVDHMFKCEMTLQSRRPVYGTTYTTIHQTKRRQLQFSNCLLIIT